MKIENLDNQQNQLNQQLIETCDKENNYRIN